MKEKNTIELYTNKYAYVHRKDLFAAIGELYIKCNLLKEEIESFYQKEKERTPERAPEVKL